MKPGKAPWVLAASLLTPACSREPCQQLYEVVESCGLVGEVAPLGREAFFAACERGDALEERPTSCREPRDCHALSECLGRVGRSQMKRDALSDIRRSLELEDWEGGLSSCRWARTVWPDTDIVQSCSALARAAVQDLRVHLPRADEGKRADFCVDLARFGELLPAAERDRVRTLCARPHGETP